MEKPEPTVADGLLRVLTPLALYYILSFAVAFIYGQLVLRQAGFAMLEAEHGQAEFSMYFQEALKTQSMEMLLVTAAVGIPLFQKMYDRDLGRRGASGLRGGSAVLEKRPFFWSLFMAAALALLLNLLVFLTPLMEWSSGYLKAEERLSGGSFGMKLLALGIASPVLEELLMRGLLFQRLKEMTGVRKATFWSALIFGIFHQNLVQGVYAFLMGLFFAYLMEWFGTILAPVLAHMASNILILLLSESRMLQFLMESRIAFAAAAVGCLLILFRGFRLLSCRKIIDNL